MQGINHRAIHGNHHSPPISENFEAASYILTRTWLYCWSPIDSASPPIPPPTIAMSIGACSCIDPISLLTGVGRRHQGDSEGKDNYAPYGANYANSIIKMVAFHVKENEQRVTVDCHPGLVRVVHAG